MPEPKTNDGAAAVAQTPEEIEAAALEAAEATAAAGEKKEGEAAAGEAAAEEKTVYTFDLGDGNVLEADTEDALRAKIIEGYRKGAQPGTAVPHEPGDARPAVAAEPAKTAATEPAKRGKALTTDEEFAIENEIQKGKPIKGLEMLLEKKYGISLDEVAEAVDVGRGSKRYAREVKAVDEFRKKHATDFVGNQHNRTLIDQYLGARQLEATVENLETAFTELKGAGLLKATVDGTAPAAPGTGAGAGAQPGAAAPGAAKPVVAAPVKKVAASSLFGKTGANQPSTKTGAKKEMSDAEMTKIAKEGGSGKLLEALEEQFKAGANG